MNVYGSNNIDVYRFVAGASTLIGSRNATHADGDTYGLEVSGTGATVTMKVYRNSSQVGADLTDTSGSRITAAGQTGMGNWSLSVAVFDNFLVEDLAGGGGTVNTQTLTDTIAVSDQSLSSASRNRLLESLLSVTDGPPVFSESFNVMVSDEIEVTDNALWQALRHRLLSDGISISDESLSQLITGGILFRVLTDGLNVSDEVLKSCNRNRVVESLLMLGDETLSSARRFAVLTDALLISDELVSAFITQTTTAPKIVIGFDQPKILIGGYAI